LLPAPLSRPCKHATQSLAVEVTEAAATIWREFRRLSFFASLLVRPVCGLSCQARPQGVVPAVALPDAVRA